MNNYMICWKYDIDSVFDSSTILEEELDPLFKDYFYLVNANTREEAADTFLDKQFQIFLEHERELFVDIKKSEILYVLENGSEPRISNKRFNMLQEKLLKEIEILEEQISSDSDQSREKVIINELIDTQIINEMMQCLTLQDIKTLWKYESLYEIFIIELSEISEQ